MTNKEAIKILEVAQAECEWIAPLEYQEAFDLAISALEKQDVPDTNVGDLISRQAAIDALDKRFDAVPMELTTEILQLRRDLRNLPSAQPDPDMPE